MLIFVLDTRGVSASKSGQHSTLLQKFSEHWNQLARQNKTTPTTPLLHALSLVPFKFCLQ
jgi:hypothetical protein